MRRKVEYGAWHGVDNIKEITVFWECDSTFVHMGGGVNFHAVWYDSTCFLVQEAEINCFLNLIHGGISDFSSKYEQDSVDNIFLLKEIKLKPKYYYKIRDAAE